MGKASAAVFIRYDAQQHHVVTGVTGIQLPTSLHS